MTLDLFLACQKMLAILLVHMLSKVKHFGTSWDMFKLGEHQDLIFKAEYRFALLSVRVTCWSFFFASNSQEQ